MMKITDRVQALVAECPDCRVREAVYFPPRPKASRR